MTKEEAKKVEKAAKNEGNGKTIAIAVLATVLGCFVITFAVLLVTGVIKFGGMEGADIELVGIDDGKTTGDRGGAKTGDSKLIDNPHKRVSVNGTAVEVGDLEFYLPSKFKAGGKNSDGAYTYNLVNDDGWAQVLVYAENSSLSPEKYLLAKSPYLDITDDDYDMNGTEWVQGESGSMLAYATELDGKNYAIIYAVKLDSDATSEAMSMIPKTLYMKKIYKD